MEWILVLIFVILLLLGVGQFLLFLEVRALTRRWPKFPPRVPRWEEVLR